MGRQHRGGAGTSGDLPAAGSTPVRSTTDRTLRAADWRGVPKAGDAAFTGIETALKALICNRRSHTARAFDVALETLGRNPSIGLEINPDDLIEVVVTVILTKPVTDALFPDRSGGARHVIVQAIDGIIDGIKKDGAATSTAPSSSRKS